MKVDCKPQIMTVHPLSNPRVLGKLRTELKAALPDVTAPLSIMEIEQLPYLSAVITEGLRLSMGTSQRQTCISPTDVMTFNDGKKQWRIHPGVSIPPPLPPPLQQNPHTCRHPDPETVHPQTPVSVAAPLVHLNPQLKSYLMTFSQGSRQCWASSSRTRKSC